MIVLGWDPGIRTLAYGVVDFQPASTRVLAYGDLGQPSDERDEVRLDRICIDVDRLMNTHMPDVMGYEQQSGVWVGNDRDDRAQTWHARRVFDVMGILRMAANTALAEPIPCYTPAPTTIKVAVLGKGYGHADKASVQRGVQRLLGVKGSSHVSDALATTIATVRQHRVALLRRQSAERRTVAR